MLNIILVVIAAIMLMFMFHPRLLKNKSWQATLTPLSSIIGSGFLIIAPMLASVIGLYAPLAVMVIVVFPALPPAHVVYSESAVRKLRENVLSKRPAAGVTGHLRL